MNADSPLATFARLAHARPAVKGFERLPQAPSLVKALARPGIVAELKPASPTEGPLRDLRDAEPLARDLMAAGAAGLSALTEPTAFRGSPRLLAAAVRSGGPVLMKDFVVAEAQLDLAAATGASAVLLIEPLLTREHSDWHDVDEAIEEAHCRDLEVVLEVYDEPGLRAAFETEADLVGVNNRDLRDPALPIEPERAARLLRAVGAPRVPVLALSGAKDASDVRLQFEAGARGVLVGTALMRARDPVAAMRALMEALP